MKRANVGSDEHSDRDPKKVKMLNPADQRRISPVDFVFNTFRKNNIDTARIIADSNKKFSEPTPEMINAYNLETTKAGRENDLIKLKNLHKSGVHLHCCNKFGDSLVHLACRRGLTNTVKFLVEEAKVSVYGLCGLSRSYF